MLTLVYGGQDILTLRPTTEPTMDLRVSVTLSGTVGSNVIGDRRYAPATLRVPCFVVGTAKQNVDHYVTLVRAVKSATQILANVQGTTYYRNLIAGGEIRPRGSALAPRFVYELILVPSEPWWRDNNANTAFLWW